MPIPTTMESVTILKFWQNATADDAGVSSDTDFTTCSDQTSLAADIRLHDAETDDDTDDADSFFDLEFTVVPPSDDKEEKKSGHGVVTSSDDAFAGKNGENRCHLLESPKSVFGKGGNSAPELNSKPLSPMSLLRSPSKFRVCTLGFKKSTSATISKNEQHKSPIQVQSKRFTAKCEAGDVPIFSIFTRDNSLRSKILKERSDDAPAHESSKRFPKDVVRKYLKLIKPLYVNFSKRYGDNMKFPEHSAKTTPSSSPAAATIYSPRKQVDEKQSNRPAALRVVSKHLGKSRSASSTVVGTVPSTASRRDDSLLQQHDGIQSAILHCKRSFNSSTRSSILSRSVSDTCQDKSIRPMRKSSEEQNRCSI